MISMFAVMSPQTGLGKTIYQEPSSIGFDEGLLWPLVSSLDIFAQELTREKRGFSEAKLENLRMLVYSPSMTDSPYALVVFADLWDTTSYVRTKLSEIDKLLGASLSKGVFKDGTCVLSEEEIQKAVQIISFTQKLPAPLQETLITNIKEFTTQTMEGILPLYTAMADVDEGILWDWNIPEFPEAISRSREIFLSLLSNIPFDKELWIEGRITGILEKILKASYPQFDPSKSDEGWFLGQLGPKTDFYIIVRSVFLKTEKPSWEKKLHTTSDNLGVLITEEVSERPF